MGRYILILVIGAFMAYGISNLTLNRNTTRAVENSSRYYSKKVAKNASTSVINMLVAKLSDSTDYRVTSPASIDIFGGSVDYTVKDTSFDGDDFVKIVAISDYSGESHTSTAYAQIDAFIPPEFMTYAAICEVKLQFKKSKFYDYNDPDQNTNIHSNDIMKVEESINYLEGFVTYTIELDKLEGTIVPNSNPGGLPVCYSAPAVELPDFDPADFGYLADHTYNSDKKYEEVTLNLGTINNPTIIYCKKKLEIKKCTINGYGVFLVKEDAKIEETGMNYSTSRIAVYALEEIEIKKSNLCGQFYAIEKLKCGQDLEDNYMMGSIASKDEIDKVEKTILYYLPPLESLTVPFFECPSTTSGGRAAQVVHWFE